jgi:B12 binding domain/Radical SAM superfamily
MKVLLVNANTYKFPPVPPIGLEHMAGSVEEGGHEARIIDLCFSAAPQRDLDEAIGEFLPDVVGMTVRNVDTVIYQDNEFFLDDIKGLIDHVKKQYGLRVIIGGSGVSADPEGVLDYLQADYALAGPGEDRINGLLDEIQSSADIPKVHRRTYRYEISCPRRRAGIDYGLYYERGGIAGFETHKGCGSSCVYCIEADTNVSFRNISDVVEEIRGFTSSGFKRFHLCDAEFNKDIDYCIDFLGALKEARLGIDWAVYMKPANYNKRLFRLMKETGVSLVTLTVDSWKKCSLYYSDVEKIIFIAKSCGLKIVVDFLGGFPYEDENTLVWYLDLFRRLQPDSVGVNTYIRLYRKLQITGIIMDDPQLKKNLLGCGGDRGFIMPVFYNHVDPARLRDLIGDDKLFRIEGTGKGVNYTRIR